MWKDIIVINTDDEFPEKTKEQENIVQEEGLEELEQQENIVQEEGLEEPEQQEDFDQERIFEQPEFYRQEEYSQQEVIPEQENTFVQQENTVEKRSRKKLFAGAVLAGSVILISLGIAWYSLGLRKAHSKTEKVLKPYEIVLMNPSETDVLQLSIGSLMLGETKQVLFCVSNGEDEAAAAFDYAMELIYTNNLALDYTLYELEAADEENATIIADDTVMIDGSSKQVYTYWKPIPTALSGEDVSRERHSKTELSGSEINSGTYILYENADSTESANDTEDAEDTETTLHSTFHLEAGNSEGDAQYFLLEIEWNESAQTNFEQYEKETDMIYIVAKAVQPEPVKKSGN